MMKLSLDSIESKLIEHADKLAFLYQATEKDIRFAGALFNSANIQTKAQYIANILGGRIIGWNPFPSVSQYQQTFILSQAINKTSIAGALVWGAAELGIIPAKYATVGKKIIWGGAVGGVFDAPDPGQAPGRTQSRSQTTQSALVDNVAYFGK